MLLQLHLVKIREDDQKNHGILGEFWDQDVPMPRPQLLNGQKYMVNNG